MVCFRARLLVSCVSQSSFLVLPGSNLCLWWMLSACFLMDDSKRIFPRCPQVHGATFSDKSRTGFVIARVDLITHSVMKCWYLSKPIVCRDKVTLGWAVRDKAVTFVFVFMVKMIVLDTVCTKLHCSVCFFISSCAVTFQCSDTGGQTSRWSYFHCWIGTTFLELNINTFGKNSFWKWVETVHFRKRQLT